ncbi:uncharacterized protein [Nicotiana sylvestris]|uniref:uncharacterized protein n=1 Tax=Nicotiana sylvestris TaxID=4096 RepID=UPI00388CA3CF
MEIHNDMGYRVYVELKKENKEFGMYPLCVTTIEKELVSGGSLNQGNIVQIDEAIQRYDSDTDDTLALDFVNPGEAIGVFELDKDLIISKTNQREVMAGQVYKDKDTLKEVMENYIISQRFQFRVDRSNAVSYALLCISKDCEWRFKASSINKSELFKVREFIDNYTCPLKDKVYEQQQASSSLIGGMIRHKLTNHKRKYTPKDIIDDVKSNLGVNVSYMLAWRAKEKGFDHCRPIVVVDGSYLKSYYTGTFVSASTLDGAGHILPLAYGVIDSENNASWTWFFEQFKIAYGDRKNMCIVSDRNESIIKSVSRVYPDVPHFACIWHLWNNVDIRVKEYLELGRYKKWARLYAPVNRGWTITSNIAESIYATLVSARELPIYDFLEEVRKMFGCWNCSNRKEATQTYTTLGKKKYQEMLTLNKAMSTRMTSKFLMPEEYCSNYYKPNTVVMTYDMPVYPLPDRNDWNIPAHVAEEVVLPTKLKRPPGRPKKKRDKLLSEFCSRKINIHVAYVGREDITSERVEMLHVAFS